MSEISPQVERTSLSEQAKTFETTMITHLNEVIQANSDFSVHFSFIKILELESQFINNFWSKY